MDDFKINLRKRAVPTCKDCGAQHYNFVDCPPREDKKPPVEWAPHDAWGHQLSDLKYLGGNTFVQRREWDR